MVLLRNRARDKAIGFEDGKDSFENVWVHNSMCLLYSMSASDKLHVQTHGSSQGEHSR